MSRQIHTAVLVIVACLLTIMSAAMPVVAEASGSKIHVGWYDNGTSSANISESVGSHGYYYEYLQALSQYTNWEYVYVPGTWEECMERLRTGEIDIMGFVSKTPDREKHYAYPALPMAVLQGLLVTADDDERLGYNDYKAFNNITVGTFRGNSFQSDFDRFCEEHGINVKYKVFKSIADIPAALRSRTIDAAVVGDEDKTENERVIASFSIQDRFFVTNAKNRKLFEELSSSMKQVNVFCPDMNTDLYHKYFSMNSHGKPLFTAEEQAFIRKHPKIIVMYDAYWPPIEYRDNETKKYKGISPEIFHLLGEKCGIEFIADDDTSTSGETLSRLADSEPENQLTTISYNYHWADVHNVRITQPFFSSGIVKVGRNFNAPHPVVAVNKKAFFTYLMKDDLARATQVHFGKQLERFDAVLNGKVDYTYCTAAQASYYLSLPKYSKLNSQEVVGYEQKICISISKNSDPALMSIISKSLASISSDEMNKIIQSNTQIVHEPTVADFIYNHRGISLTIAVAFILLITFALVQIQTNKLKRVASEKASRAKSDFLSQMSHDMRTPLNSIIGMTSLAIDAKDDPEKSTSYMRQVEISGKYLLSLINDVLDMSAIEAGKLKLVEMPFDLKKLIDTIYATFEQQCAMKNLKFDIQVISQPDVLLIGDHLRLNQILVNLLSNAYKFTEHGNIRLCVEQVGTQGDRVVMRFIVSDTGCGMSDNMRSRLFQPFEQESASSAQEHKGSGLGLSIVNNLVTLMKGNIEAASHKGKGTSFTVVLPFGRSHEQQERSEAQTISCDLTGHRVLIVEDNAMNRVVASGLLQKAGVLCDMAVNGKDGAAKFLESKRGTYDAILMDIQMPVMDGYEATEAIRSSSHPEAADIPIIAMTANAFTEDVAKAVSIGMNAHVAKPIELDVLLAALVRVISGRKA